MTPNDAPRLGSACEWGLDAVALMFLPLLALVSHAVAPLVAFAGLMALGRGWPLDTATMRPLRVPAGLCLALVVWGFVSMPWSIDPGRSLLIAARLAGLFAAALALVVAAGRLAAPGRLTGCFVAGLVLSLVLAELQFATGGALTQRFFERRIIPPNLNQLCDAVAILTAPVAVMLFLRRRRIAAALVALAAAATVYHLVGSAAKLGFAVTVAGLVLFRLGGRNLARAFALVSVLAVLTAPVTLPRLAHLPAVSQDARTIKFSLWHRLQIWAFVGDRIAERPLLGWGLDSSRAIPGGRVELQPGAERLPLHPHDAALQVWLELGLPGALLFAAFAAWLWLAAARLEGPPLYRSAVSASLATACFAVLGTYGAWQEWWIATLSLALFLELVMARIVAPADAAEQRLTP